MIVKLINDKQVTFGSTRAGVVTSIIASAWLESSKRHWEKCPSLSKMEIKTDCTQQLPLVGVTFTTVYYNQTYCGFFITRKRQLSWI